jgi:hypothetical protein
MSSDALNLNQIPQLVISYIQLRVELPMLNQDNMETPITIDIQPKAVFKKKNPTRQNPSKHLNQKSSLTWGGNLADLRTAGPAIIRGGNRSVSA